MGYFVGNFTFTKKAKHLSFFMKICVALLIPFRYFQFNHALLAHEGMVVGVQTSKMSDLEVV